MEFHRDTISGDIDLTLGTRVCGQSDFDRLTLLIPLITGVIACCSHLLSGVDHRDLGLARV